jgi:hypothetical protein
VNLIKFKINGQLKPKIARCDWTEEMASDIAPDRSVAKSFQL